MVLFPLQRSDGIRPALNSPVERPNGDQEEGEASVQVRSAPEGRGFGAGGSCVRPAVVSSPACDVPEGRGVREGPGPHCPSVLG